MDKQVQLALAKWPNVPHCYGWLGLDARGAWRMRDQRAQDLGLLGSKIANATLRGFIDRNYQADAMGQYFFQNGPQRVYVELQSTPYIAHSDPVQGWVLHTGQTLTKCDAVWMTKEGNLILKSGVALAQIDDRDMLDAMACVYIDRTDDADGQRATDEQILTWLNVGRNKPKAGLTFLFKQKAIPIRLASLDELIKKHPFVSHPKP
jgi:hypothetical protein